MRDDPRGPEPESTVPPHHGDLWQCHDLPRRVLETPFGTIGGNDAAPFRTVAANAEEEVIAGSAVGFT